MPTVEEFLQSKLDKVGIFRVYPIAWNAQKYDSEAIAIRFQFAIHQEWHPNVKAWSEVWPIGFYVEHDAWVVKKKENGGGLNEGTIANLGKCDLWDGEWDRLKDAPKNVFVLGTVESEMYQNKPQFRATWINPDADEPVARGGLKPTDGDLLQSLRQRFQGPTRAIIGGKPTGAPPAPPAQPQPAPVQQHQPAPQQVAPAPPPPQQAPQGAPSAPTQRQAPAGPPGAPQRAAPPQQPAQRQPGPPPGPTPFQPQQAPQQAPQGQAGEFAPVDEADVPF